MECKFKQLNVRAEKVFLTLRTLRYALCVMTRGSDLLQNEINSDTTDTKMIFVFHHFVPFV
jgi:hypothetical protein